MKEKLFKVRFKPYFSNEYGNGEITGKIGYIDDKNRLVIYDGFIHFHCHIDNIISLSIVN